MTKTMLIDATHAEETRVAVVDGHRLADFDYESKVRKQLKGSVFLAKVTRVEPSLQAAFVNFGGNRHGFLPFSEIHPDYFRIPVADREALLAAQAAELEQHDEEETDEDLESEMNVAPSSAEEPEEDEEDSIEEVGGEDKPAIETHDDPEEPVERAEAFPVMPVSAEEELDEDESDEDDSEDEDDADDEEGDDEDDDEEDDEGEEEEADASELPQPEYHAEKPAGEQDNNEGAPEGGQNRNNGRRRGRGRGGRRDGRNRGGRGRSMAADSRRVEMVGGDGVEGDRPFRYNMRRNYKIQEVVKRGQIMLIQVSKEERGNKGAAVTTYLSLPGRYCVLMPNSPRGGGVSRKIDNFADRRKMKEILTDLTVPEGMSVILRTAGVERSKVEIKRDLDYLMRLWNTIREETLKSTAPAVIYEEGNLIKRAIRDLYGRDIEQVHVAGEEGYNTARDFMKMLMPTHVDNVKEYTDEKIPLFHRYRVESQISDIGKMTVTLKSGGYLVINPTEALVSIDVNSGKATKERHIEETAVKTNLESADEVARQLRLRDLGGLIVIDFIDMEDRRNNRRVEQRLKEALSSDRARIQVGRISSFGLLELSRQRLNPSLTEMQFEVCKHCQGVGRVPTPDFSAIKVMRALEDEGIKGRALELNLSVPGEVALYILNNKREMVADIEERYSFRVHIRTEPTFCLSDYRIDILRKNANAPEVEEDEPQEEARAERAERPAEGQRRDEQGEGQNGPRKRRRGRRGGRGRRERGERDNNGPRQEGDEQQPNFGGRDPNPADMPEGDEDDGQEKFMASIEEAARPPREDGRPHRNNNNRRGGRNRNRGGRGDGQGRSQQGQGGGQHRPHRDGQRPPRHDQGHSEKSFEGPDDIGNRREPEPAQMKANAPRGGNSEHVLAAKPREYETVNKQPEQKKKGWWNRLVD